MALPHRSVTGVKGPFVTCLKPAGDTIVLSETTVKAMTAKGEDNAMLTERTHGGVDMTRRSRSSITSWRSAT
jgi:hypothetical protein